MHTLKYFLSIEGKIKRSVFWVIIIFLLFGVVMSSLFAYEHDSYFSRIILVLLLWVGFVTYAKRCNDIKSPWWVGLTIYIPYVNILTGMIIGVVPSYEKSNSHESLSNIDERQRGDGRKGNINSKTNRIRNAILALTLVVLPGIHLILFPSVKILEAITSPVQMVVLLIFGLGF